MINKQYKFASAGAQTTGWNDSMYQEGMHPNTIAMAEDVNSFGNQMDTDVYSVCKEVANVITNGVIDKDGGNGYTLNESNNAQLLTTMRDMSNGFMQTGIMFNGTESITIPYQNGVTSIVFNGLKIMFNEGGYFGNGAAKMQFATLTATFTVTNSVPLGVLYLYAKLSGGAVSIQYSQNLITGDQGTTYCFLGSCFIINNNGTRQIQSTSWKFQPWLQNTPAIVRESPTAQTKGGLITANSGRTLKMGKLEIKAEGINFDAGSHTQPNIKTIAAGNFTYKFLYPGYNPSASALSNLDTTHLYNLTAGTWDDVSSKNGYIVMVPCITPTGQTLVIPAMSTVSSGNYLNIYNTIEEAETAIYTLPYTDTSTDKTRSRVIYLGFSMIVKIGATDLTDSKNFVTVGMLPQALTSFSYAGGQTGGSTGTYNPMPSYTWNQNSLTLTRSYLNIITGRSANIQLTFPSPANGVFNEIEVQYAHASGQGGVTFVQGTAGNQNQYAWWDGVSPTLTNGVTYLFHFEHVNGKWMGTIKQSNQTPVSTQISNGITSLLNSLYPLYSLYIGTQNTCPMATLMPGTTWTLVATDKALWGGSGSNGNSTIAAGLPNITGTFMAEAWEAQASGAFSVAGGASWPEHDNWGNTGRTFTLDASRGGTDTIYGKSSTVQPPAYRVNVWRRTA